MNPDAFVKRRFAFILGGMVAVSAYFQASGVSHLLGHQIARDGASSRPPATARGEAESAPPPSEDAPPSATPILERNPFDSTTGPLRPPPGEAPSGQADLSHLDPYLAPPCDKGRVVLIAVSEDPEWSFAAIAADGGPTALGRRGGEIAGRKVEDIAWDRVWLTSGGARCQMQLGQKRSDEGKTEPQPPPAPEPPRATQPRRSGRSSVPPEIASNIKRVGETEIDIDRSAAERIFEHPELVTETSAAIPEMRDNQVVGLKMMVKPGSVLESLGIQSGDLVRSVNSIDLTDPQKAMMAYSRMRSDKSLSVVVERDGRPVRLKVNIR
ncbi:general secretion pathway protein GspC [Sorangium cellulosum]|uniref:General secretion pathway protein GspC n=1 Tax=Sorangium cellulosum TaxID=56 RepID=A0A150SI71_SORCE|nr:general secretion pathway protein GspC [Sorangium cellulosum]